MKLSINSYTIKNLNACACFGLCVVLIWAQWIQFYLAQLPCPLCLFQRIGLIGVSFGFLLNAYDKPRPGYYFLAALSAVFTLCVGLRQVLLHIVPNTGAYGSPVFGLHLYTWSVLIGGACILGIILLVLMNTHQFDEPAAKKPVFLYKLLFLLVILMALINVVTVFAICGLGACPSSPVHYLWQKG